MDTDVVIAGAGPAGLMLATELALADVGTIVVETLKTRSGQSKATNRQPLTAEIFVVCGPGAAQLPLGWSLAGMKPRRRADGTFARIRHGD